jgi:hypothetical protein
MKTIRLINHDKPAKVDDDKYAMLMEFGVWSYAWSEKHQQNRVVCELEDGSQIHMADVVMAASNSSCEKVLEGLRAFRREFRQKK